MKASDITAAPAFAELKAEARRIAGVDLQTMFAADPGRFGRLSRAWSDILFDFSKQRLDERILAMLFKLGRQAGVEAARDRMRSGEEINATERRAVLHMALRHNGVDPIYTSGHDVMPAVRAVRSQIRSFAADIRSGRRTGASGKPFTHVVNIGIGGSDLGPFMVYEALRTGYHSAIEARFVSNVDGAHLTSALAGLDPATTLFVVVSKTFTTQETMANARSARHWLVAALGADAVARHFVAVSTNAKAVGAFGIDAENMFTFWDWVGGRFSLWSAVGLSIAIALGPDLFDELLAGAEAMDRHFCEAPLEQNLPVIMALIGVWNVNFLGAAAQAVIPYDQGLHRFPAYLQQAEMESNGKSTRLDGSPVSYATSPIVWGEPGTNGQHAFFQLLHQGTAAVPVDFIMPARSRTALGGHHDMLVANCFAQAEALMLGRGQEEAEADMRAAGMSPDEARRLAPHRTFPGNRPSSMILLPEVDANHLGRLIALYEHKIFVQGVIWGINSFDQWGVELGKTLAARILPQLTLPDEPTGHDSSTLGLMNYFKRYCRT